MEYVIWFIVSFIIIYLMYLVFVVKKARRGKKIPTEAQYLIYKYKLDIKLFSYRKFLKILGLVISFDIAIVATVVGNVDGIVFQILLGFVVVIPIIIITFSMLGKYYQKKQEKDNSLELAKEKKYLDKKDKKKKNKKDKKDKKGMKKNG